MYKTLSFFFTVFLVLAAYFQIPELMQYDSKRILQLILFVVIGFVLLLSFFQKARNNQSDYSLDEIKVSRFVYVSTVLLFIFGLTSVLQASNFKYAFLEFSLFFLLLTLIISIAPKSLKEHYFLGRLILFIALIYSSLYIVIFFGNYISSFLNPMITIWPEKYNFILTINGVELTGKETLYFDNIRFFNHTQIWTLPLLVGLLTYFQKERTNFFIKALLFFLISCWWMLILAATARGAILGILLSLTVLAFIWRKDALAFVKNSLTSLGTGGILYYLLFILPVDSIGRTIFRISSSRPNRFAAAIEAWWQNPFFGLGPMHYAKIGEAQFVGHPHNFYLQFLSEWGIFSFIAFLSLLIAGWLLLYKNSFKTKETSSNRLIFLTFAWSIMAGLAYAFFSGVMMTPMSQIWFVLITAWFIGYKRYDMSIKNNWFINYKYIYLAYIFFLIMVVWMVYEDVFSLADSYSAYLTNYPDSIFHPRFWVQGLFE